MGNPTKEGGSEMIQPRGEVNPTRMGNCKGYNLIDFLKIVLSFPDPTKHGIFFNYYGGAVDGKEEN